MPVGGQATSQEAEDELYSSSRRQPRPTATAPQATSPATADPRPSRSSRPTPGPATLTIQGSFDGINWYACGYMQVDAVLNPARSVSPIAVTASPYAHVFQLLDTYNLYRAVISATAGSLTLTAILRGLPL